MRRTARKPRAGTPQPASRGPAVQASRPHRGSWVDRLTAAIDRSPLPAWSVYFLLFVVILAVLLGLAGIEATVDLPIYLLTAAWAIFPLSLIHHLDRVSAGALDQLRPALDLEAVEADRVRLGLTTMPVFPPVVASLAGAGFLLFFYAANRDLFEPMHRSPALTVFGMAILTFSFGVLGVLVYHTIRQLRMVSALYDRVARLDLFNLSPLYGFAALSARTSITWAVGLYFSMALNPGLLENVVALAAYGLQVLIVLATFTWPLIGIHRRIMREKEAALAEIGGSLNRAIAELNRQTRSTSLARMDGLNKMILAQIAARDLLARVPAWPWSPGTPVAVGSALLLPVILFIIERVLGDFLGL